MEAMPTRGGTFDEGMSIVRDNRTTLLLAGETSKLVFRNLFRLGLKEMNERFACG